jgi:hypothetical protein
MGISVGHFDSLDGNETERGDMTEESVLDLRSADSVLSATRLPAWLHMPGRKLLQNTWDSIGSGGAYQVEPNEVASFTQ